VLLTLAINSLLRYQQWTEASRSPQRLGAWSVC